MSSRGTIRATAGVGKHRLVISEPDPESEETVAAGIVARIRSGARDAEAEMVERYGQGLLYLLKRRTRDPELARDVRQDTFRVAIEKLRAEPIEQPERLGAFLRGIAMKLVTAHERKDYRRATTPDCDAVDAAADDAAGPYDHVSIQQLRRAVLELLDELRTPRDREILKRLYLEEQDKPEICAALGVDSLHFNRVLFRAKARFREILTRDERHHGLRLVTAGTIRDDEAL